MDYQGNYFPEEHDENESKIYRTVKGIFKWTMYGISFVLYGVIFFLLFINRDSKILERNYMAEIEGYADVENENGEFYGINTKDFMNYDGSIQLFHVDYSKTHSLLEIGVKFNADKIANSGIADSDIEVPKEERATQLAYILTDSNGNVYDLEHKVDDYGGRYGFARITFSGVDIDLDSNNLRYDSDSPTDARTGVSYSLSVYRCSDGELMNTFKIYDNAVTFQKSEYND
ncbi:MAG: hypothetical protein IJB49_09065 [Clostridia bacterium]|nr:hypothetical protein [Clostridia bacterium]